MVVFQHIIGVKAYVKNPAQLLKRFSNMVMLSSPWYRKQLWRVAVVSLLMSCTLWLMLGPAPDDPVQHLTVNRRRHPAGLPREPCNCSQLEQVSKKKKKLLEVLSPLHGPRLLHMVAPQLQPNVDLGVMEKNLHRLLRQKQVHCISFPRMGNVGDGGWNICADPPYIPQPPCIVYSIGVNNDWSFDDAIGNTYGCEVHSFDPSMHEDNHVRRDHVWFYHIGVGGQDRRDDKNWTMKALHTIRQELGHVNRVMDILKMDIEYSEWEVFPSMFHHGDFNSIKQLIFELHLPLNPDRQQIEDTVRLLSDLHLRGFRRYHWHENVMCRYTSQWTNETVSHCYELYYINIHFMKLASAKHI